MFSQKIYHGTCISIDSKLSVEPHIHRTTQSANDMTYYTLRKIRQNMLNYEKSKLIPKDQNWSTAVIFF